MKQLATCYCCDNPATSREHAPPLCFFPETKDLPPGINLRQRLITVPACDEHNLRKSKDDEYLLISIASSVTTNDTGTNHFVTKIIRSIDRDPTLINRFLSKASKLTVEGNSPEESFETALVSTEDHRIIRVLEFVGRAIYFHQFNRKWLDKIWVHPEFLTYPSLDSSSPENQALIQLRRASTEIFEKLPRLGHNPSVFQYQLAPGSPHCHAIARLHFYGKTRVTMTFNHDA